MNNNHKNNPNIALQATKYQKKTKNEKKNMRTKYVGDIFKGTSRIHTEMLHD